MSKPVVIGGLALAGLVVVGGIVVYTKGFNKGHSVGFSKGQQEGYVQGELQATTRYESQIVVIRTDYENKIRELQAQVEKLKSKEK